MSKKKEPLNTQLPDSLQLIDEQIEKLEVHKSVLYDKLISSENTEEIMKAVQYSKKVQPIENSRAFLFAPDNEFYNGLGFKSTVKPVPFELLRSMANTPIISAVIGTRISQISEFSNFSLDLDRPGWTIRKKLSRFERASDEYKYTDKDKGIIEKIADFLENGGINAKFTLHEDFFDFLKVFPKDLLELDQGVFEIQRTRGGDMLTYNLVDAATIRLLETIDPNYIETNKYENLKYKGVDYPPYYCQVWRERILQTPKTKEDIIWYPYEMCFAVRNKTSNIYANGYGHSELETLFRIVSWILESMEYNGRFFTNGSNPRGFFVMKGGADPRMLNDFRMAWRSMVTGWQNAHKIPIFEADKIDWVDMHHNNREMEFSQWLEFLTLITCAVYKIDSSEMGFKFRQQKSLFGDGGQKERTEHSIDKGLKPLLRIIQKSIDKFIVGELDEGYEFVFTGVDLEDEEKKLDSDVKKITNGMVAMGDKFKEYSGREFDPKKDIILNPVYLQSQQMQQYGGQGMNEMVDEMNGGGDVGVQNPFEMYQKALLSGKSDDPFTKGLIDYINKEFRVK